MSGSSSFLQNRNYSESIHTTSGSFIVPNGVNLLFVEMYGGGGGGASNRLPLNITGRGGKGGEYKLTAIKVDPGETVTITIGTGGAGGAGAAVDSFNRGTDGVRTILSGTFGLVHANGGSGGDVIFIQKLFGHVGVPGTDASGGGRTSIGGDGGFGTGGDGGVGGTPGTAGGVAAGGGASNNAVAGAGGSGRIRFLYRLIN